MIQVGMKSYDAILDVTFTVESFAGELPEGPAWNISADDGWVGTVVYYEQAMKGFK